MVKSNRGFKYHLGRVITTTLAHLNLLTESIALPRRAIRNVIWYLGNIKGKKVLEFGCGVGTLTMHLVQAVGIKGMVYATDSMQPELSITKLRLEKRYHKNARVIKDILHDQRVHPNINKTDVIASVNTLVHIKVTSVLKEMNKRLRINGNICFLEHDKLFGFIPNAEWLMSDSKIKYIFRQAGFIVDVKRERGFAQEYVYIYGKKFKKLPA